MQFKNRAKYAYETSAGSVLMKPHRCITFAKYDQGQQSLPEASIRPWQLSLLKI